MPRLMFLMAGLLGVVVLVGNHGRAAADDKVPADVQKQLDDLRKELDKQREELQKQLEELRKQLPMQVRPLPPPPPIPDLPVFRFGYYGRMDGRLGVMVEKPSAVLADQLGLKEGKGLVVTYVMTDTPAAKAGLKVHDVVLQFNGKDVSDDVPEFAQVVGGVKADAAVDVVVLRKGKQETIKDLKLPEVKPLLRPGGRPLQLQIVLPGRCP